MGCSEVTPSPRAITLATCLTVLCGAAISWPIYKAAAEERKLVEVAKQLRSQAEQGDAKAQGRLGYGYRRGAGVAQDFAEAFRWFRKSAEQGDAYAQFYVGFLYHEGRGVARDYAKSARWSVKPQTRGTYTLRPTSA